MKKILLTLVTCLLLVGTVLFFSRNEVKINSENLNKIFTNSNETMDIVSEKTCKLQSNPSIYYYSKLSDLDKEIYKNVFMAVKDLRKEIKLENPDKLSNDQIMNKVSSVISAFTADHPEVFWLDSKYEVHSKNYIIKNQLYINVEYTVDSKAELENKINEIDKKLNNIVAQNITTEMTDYKKALVLHDYIAANISYYSFDDVKNIPNSKHNIDGAVIEKDAVCDGITKLYQVVLDKVNIENIFVEGQADDESHAWNLIKLDDEYYHTDVTSDMAIKKNGERNLIIHAYFNIKDNEIATTHKMLRPELLPKCISEKYNYYIYENMNVDSLDDAKSKLKYIIQNVKYSDSGLLEVRMSNVLNGPDKLIHALYDNNFNDMKILNNTKLEYKKLLDTYIVIKK